MSRPTDSTRADARTLTIAVTFFADLRRFLPRGAEGPQRYTVPEGATAADLLVAIGVEPGAEVTIAVDGELGNRETLLRDGSEVMLLNPMEGGAAAEGEATNQNIGGAAAEGEATNQNIGGAAAEGEATNQNIGGAAARWRSRSLRRGDQQGAEATTKIEGG
jgi:sulfur carrier protein ThiS